uniref:RRM domain-containing protein n=2 Tax=Lotharella oceanica TaxID=641309 RepID=A0A7S2TRE1_9EUKA|mmetsp:Transcript_2589/g.4915  ORF Transcript_2589/g.4915 Transcript_2589/m.4915 type:complete len:330 (+) Transcript_2589:376-1365(+)
MRYRDTGASRGFGFAYFRSFEHADKAVQESRKHVLDGRPVEIQHAKSKEEISAGRPSRGRGRGGYYRGRGRGRGGYGRGRGYDSRPPYGAPGRVYDSYRGSGDDDFPSKKIFVGGISHDVTPKQFEEYFEKFGRVSKAILKTDMATGRVRGFGFVTFEDEKSADDCVKIQYHNLNGKEMECVKAEPKPGGPPPSRGGYRSERPSYGRGGSRGGGGYTSSFTGSYYERGGRSGRPPPYSQPAPDPYYGSHQGYHNYHPPAAPGYAPAPEEGGYPAPGDPNAPPAAPPAAPPVHPPRPEPYAPSYGQPPQNPYYMYQADYSGPDSRSYRPY